MHPEQRRTSFALRRRLADSAPQGVLSTGQLQGFIQSARPPLFCFLLPRVHAADAAAAQPAQIKKKKRMKSEYLSTALALFSKGTFSCLFSATQRYPEEITNVVNSGAFGALAGFVYGGLPAARFARERYIQASQAELYTNRVDAVRSAHNAAIRGFVRYGWRWSWRVAVIVTLFSSVSTGLSVYQDRDAVSQYAAAGAVTVGLFRLTLGLRGLVAGSIIGAVLGIPVGALVIGLQSLTGETVRERRRRERRELYELKLAEWAARLQLTDELISNLNVSSQAEETSKDMQRIQELLSLPQNEDAVKDSSGQ
uniref:Complex I assembly factor TIMMDC1, mitochondrial n=1 Tax=Amphilophus citrinellus TaxID=61819 RepID=A0A3Q0SH63_AMPCI